jgi:hypothetical protein
MTDTMHNKLHEVITEAEMDLFEVLVTRVAEQYDGALEEHTRINEWEPPTWYTATDTERVHKLLTTLWSEHITAKTLDRIFRSLTCWGLPKHLWANAHYEKD